MGERGPVGKRVDQRHGHRARADLDAVTRAPGASEVEVPKGNAKWHPVAKRWFHSLAESGQSRWYEPSDWATAALIAESISRELRPQVVGTTDDGKLIKAQVPPKGASLAAWLKAMSSLLVTEGDRRRVRIELDRSQSGRDDGEVDDVSDLAMYRQRIARESG